jgi:hypothetical protein
LFVRICWSLCSKYSTVGMLEWTMRTSSASEGHMHAPILW